MSEVASEQAPSAKVCFRMARWLIAMATMTMTRTETSGFTVQLNTDQDSARQNFFYNSASRDPDQEGSPCYAAHSPRRIRWVGCYFFALNNPGEIRGFFIAYVCPINYPLSTQAVGKCGANSRLLGKCGAIFAPFEILPNPPKMA